VCNNHIYSVLLFWQQTHIHSLSRAARNLDLHTHTPSILHVGSYNVFSPFSFLFFLSFYLSASVFVSSSCCLLLPYLISGFPAHNMTVFVFPPLHHLFIFISLRYFMLFFPSRWLREKRHHRQPATKKGNEEKRRLAFARSGGSVRVALRSSVGRFWSVRNRGAGTGESRISSINVSVCSPFIWCLGEKDNKTVGEEIKTNNRKRGGISETFCISRAIIYNERDGTAGGATINQNSQKK
jgi:hypothetical protein